MRSGHHPSSASKGLCVLLLEDDDGDAYLTGRALLRLDRVDEVVRLRDGKEALAALSSGRVAPDLAFVDLQMPTMNGLDFLSACMDQNLASIPMIVLTSSSDRKDALRSRVHGALRVITKPDDPAELKRLLEDAIQALAPQPNAVADTPAWRITPAPATSPPPMATARAAPAPQFGRRQPSLTA